MSSPVPVTSRDEGIKSGYQSVWVLSGPKNFGAWKQLMRAQLECKELWDLVLKPHDSKTDAKSDREALLILKQSIAPAELEKTGVCLHAHDLWKKIQENYEGSRQALLGTVSAEWATLTRRQGEDLVTFSGRFESLMAKMEAINYEVPADQKFHFFVRNLTGALREFAFTWKLCNPNGDISALISAVKTRHHTDVMMDEASRQERTLYTNDTKGKQGGKQGGRNSGQSGSANSPSPTNPSSSSNPQSKDQQQQKTSKSSGNTKITCTHCGHQGHKWRECRKLEAEMTAKHIQQGGSNKQAVAQSRANEPAPAKTEHLFMVSEAKRMEALKDEWVADSGSTRHLTPYDQCLTDVVRFNEPVKIYTGGQAMLAWGQGSYKFVVGKESCTLTNVLFVPGFPVNIISLTLVAKTGHKVEMSDECIQVKSASGEVVMEGRLHKGLLVFELTPAEPEPTIEEVYYGTTLDDWHIRFAHLPKHVIEDMARKKMVNQLDVGRPAADPNPCIDCLLGRICRTPHPPSPRRPMDPNYLTLHFDTCGPMKTTSVLGNRYLVVGVEESSNFRFVVPIKLKSEAANVVKMTVNQLHQWTSKTVVKIHTDNGGEYMSTDLRGWLAEKGISHTFSTAYTPEQNGTAERAIRAILDGARVQLTRAKLPDTLWDESAMSTCYALNYAPSPRNPSKTRFELLFGSKPNVGNLRAFGQLAVVRLSDPNITKLEARGKVMPLVGYTDRFNSYRFWDRESGTIVVNCNARFLPIATKHLPSTEEDVQLEWTQLQPAAYETPVSNSNAHSGMEAVVAPSSPTINSHPQTGVEVVATSGSSLTSLGAYPDAEAVATPNFSPTAHDAGPSQSTSPGRRGISVGQDVSILQSPGTDYQDAHHDSISDIFNFDDATIGNLVELIDDAPHQGPVSINDAIHAEIAALRGASQPEHRMTRALANKVPIYQHQELVSEARGKRPAQVQQQANFFTIDEEPQSYKAALASPSRDQWRQAISDEIESLQKNGTWTLVDRPKGVKTVKTRWLFKIKRGADGSIARHKARLVAKGYTQVEGIDFTETFAPVASLMLVRLLIAIACRRRLHLFQLDIKTAFLHGTLDETIYLEPPEGLNTPKGQVCLLNKSLYGLKQAPRQWYKRLEGLLVGLGLTKSQHDDCLFFNKAKTLILLCYVDDLCCVCEQESDFKKLVAALSTHLELTHGAGLFLGMEVSFNRARGEASLKQERFIQDLLHRYGMTSSNPVTTPEELKFDTDGPTLPDQAIDYKRLLGSLIWLSIGTRPDIAHAVNMACRAAEPTAAHIALLKRILRYLRGTSELGITFKGDAGRELVAYSDADYANDLPSRRSTTGYLLHFHGPLMWRSSRQQLVTLSSTEAEYVAACTCVRDLVPIKRILSELDADTTPTIIRMDNQSAIRMGHDLVSRQRTKHIDVRARWLSERVDDGQIKMEHVSGEDNVADILTKPLAGPRFVMLRALLMGLVLLAPRTTEAYSFSKVDPVYYRPTGVAYITGNTDQTTAIIVANPCSTYFSGLMPNPAINVQLILACENWHRMATFKAKLHCQAPRTIENLQAKTNSINNKSKRSVEELDRDKRFVSGAVALVVIGPAVTYSIVQGERNAKNLKTLAESVNNVTHATQQAMTVFNATRHAIHELNDQQVAIKLELFYLNSTMEGYGKALALAFDAYNYFSEFKDHLRTINHSLKQGKISSRFLELTKEKLWEPGAEEHSFFSKCRYQTDANSQFMVTYEYNVPDIDTDVKIVEADAFKVWSHEERNLTCRLKYIGPRYILVNTTNDCLMDVDTSWLSGNTLEGHPCTDGTRDARVVPLTSLSKAYHRDVCLREFEPMASDIQVKRHNGFYRIYCYGFKIVIGTNTHQCPIEPFELPLSQPWALNGHQNHAREKHTVIVNAEELHLNREIARRFNLRPDIKGVNLTALDDSVSLINSMFHRIGVNITLDSLGLADYIPSAGFITHAYERVKEFATYGIIAIGTGAGLILLVVASPILQIMLLGLRSSARLVRWSLKSRVSTSRNRHDHYV